MVKAGIKAIQDFSTAASAAGVSYDEISADLGRVKGGNMGLAQFTNKYPALFDGSVSAIGARIKSNPRYSAAQKEARIKNSLTAKARRAYNQAQNSNNAGIKNLGTKLETKVKNPPKTAPQPAQPSTSGQGSGAVASGRGGVPLTPVDYGGGADFGDYERARSWAGNNLSAGLGFNSFAKLMDKNIRGWANMTKKSKNTIWGNY